MRHTSAFCALLLSLALSGPAAADPMAQGSAYITPDIAVGAALDDGPWIDLPPGIIIDTSAPTLDTIRAMANLDGDPTVTTEDEARMMATLSFVLLGSPVVAE